MAALLSSVFPSSQPKLSDAARKFLDADLSKLIQELSDDEKIAMLSGPDWWNTRKVERFGIPAIRMSDGPNGARGASHLLSSPAQCIPCATSLGSTFDPELIHEAGAFLASETKIKAAVVLLAPTCNIQRNPLGGRAFESFSEDPHLSGTLAAAYVNGLQSNGVASTIKHFVCNDQEHERTAVSSELSARALREIYLMPFMIAQRDAQPLAYMTSYGRIHGKHVSEDGSMIGDNGILRKEWGFKGLVMSDWFGTYATDEPIKAGLDLEMPGPSRWRNPLLINHLLSCQKLRMSDIEKRVYNVLELAQRLAKISPDVVFGDGVEHETKDTTEVKALNRKLAANGMVLLKNDLDVLPIKAGLKVAVVGPNAKARVASGGGSAFLKSSYIVSPWAGISENAPDGTKLTAPNGKPGWEATFFSQDAKGEPLEEVGRYVILDSRVKLNDTLPAGITREWTLKLNGSLKIDSTGPFELGLTVSGRAKLWIDDKMLIDNWTKQIPGGFFYGQGTREEKATIDVVAGKALKVYVEYTNTPPPTDGNAKKDRSQPALMLGVRLGGCPAIDPDEAMQAAVDLAKESDVVVVVAGLTSEWEAEGSDRPTADLPGRQHELIEKVAAANPKTVVVVQAGSFTSMHYAEKVASIVQAWYSGNEVGNAISDVLYGKHNPSGKLPISLPKKIEDIGPAAYNNKSENGKIHYREDLFVGYKHYAANGTKPRYAFGHGLSYTTFLVSDLKVLKVTNPEDTSAFCVDLTATVTNTGKVTGSEVVQAYVSLPTTSRFTHPHAHLRAFSKVKDLVPGTSKSVSLSFNKYGVSYWDDRESIWVVENGVYTVSVGTASDDLPLKDTFTLEKGFTWSGL
ncbi:hypothetical protein FRB96_007175 [Tulasnella sp. 330]|nr:hypothetical protein FRB96_007175 [Tulasnella sp. 330]KAG8883287.1 hypothetical protein FRB98_003195 [Tulasnella sp. 332]